jgi:hypothetical protein
MHMSRTGATDRSLRTLALLALAGLAAPRVAAAQSYVGREFDLDPTTAPDSRTRSEQQPAVAFDGTNYLAVWVDEESDSSRILSQRVDRLGNRLGPSVVQRPSVGFPLRSPSVAFDGQDFVVVWQRAGNSDVGSLIEGVRVGRDGGMGSSLVPQATLAIDARPRIACEPSRCLLVWIEPEGATNGSRIVQGRWLTAAGASTVSVRMTDTPSLVNSVAVSFAAGRYLVAWSENRLASGGRPVVRGTALPGGASSAMPASDLATGEGSLDALAVATDGTQHLLAWQRSVPGVSSGAIEAVRVDSSGARLDATPWTLGTGLDSAPTVAYDGSHFLVAWQTLVTQWSDIRGVRIARDGVRSAPIEISDTIANEITPAAVGDGAGRVLVAYATNQDARARILGFDGAPGMCAAGTECATGFCLGTDCCNSFCDNGGDPCVTASCAGGMCTRARDPHCGDAGTPDAAHGDAGLDASVPDAALETPGSGLVFRGGACACRAAGAPGRGAGAVGGVLAVLAAALRGRRRRALTRARA